MTTARSVLCTAAVNCPLRLANMAEWLLALLLAPTADIELGHHGGKSIMQLAMAAGSQLA